MPGKTVFSCRITPYYATYTKISEYEYRLAFPYDEKCIAAVKTQFKYQYDFPSKTWHVLITGPRCAMKFQRFVAEYFFKPNEPEAQAHTAHSEIEDDLPW